MSANNKGHGDHEFGLAITLDSEFFIHNNSYWSIHTYYEFIVQYESHGSVEDQIRWQGISSDEFFIIIVYGENDYIYNSIHLLDSIVL